jgi:dCTP diphosphatase
MMAAPNSFLRFEDARARAYKFCSDRDWFTFHQPRNLLMALSGECGELGEIFQWKGPLKNGLDESFTARDKEHVGEELSDVLIYSTRLCDVCSIDLSGAIKFCLKYKEAAFTVAEETAAEFRSSAWDPIEFSEVEKELIESQEGGNAFFASSRSPRDMILKVNTYLGDLSGIFLSHREEETHPGLGTWDRPSITRATLCLACICILLVWIAHVCGLELSRCAFEKMNKNEAKYPVMLAKGSSAKYTEYVDKLTIKSTLSSSIGLAVGISAAVLWVLLVKKPFGGRI